LAILDNGPSLPDWHEALVILHNNTFIGNEVNVECKIYHHPPLQVAGAAAYVEVQSFTATHNSFIDNEIIVNMLAAVDAWSASLFVGTFVLPLQIGAALPLLTHTISHCIFINSSISVTTLNNAFVSGVDINHESWNIRRLFSLHNCNISGSRAIASGGIEAIIRASVSISLVCADPTTLTSHVGIAAMLWQDLLYHASTNGGVESVDAAYYENVAASSSSSSLESNSSSVTSHLDGIRIVNTRLETTSRQSRVSIRLVRSLTASIDAINNIEMINAGALACSYYSPKYVNVSIHDGVFINTPSIGISLLVSGQQSRSSSITMGKLSRVSFLVGHVSEGRGILHSLAE
jgi:hypothetical protein